MEVNYNNVFIFLILLWNFYFIVSVGGCPTLDDPANGMVSVTGTETGDTATYTCNAGYELIGSMTLTCLSSGSWSDEPPTCRRKFKPCLP